MEMVKDILLILFWLLSVSVMLSILIFNIKANKRNKETDRNLNEEIDLQKEYVSKKIEQILKEKPVKKKTGRPKKGE